MLFKFTILHFFRQRPIRPWRIFFIIVLLPSSVFSAELQEGNIIHVVDGDTAYIKINKTIERVRFLGIDTPELHDKKNKPQCFGKEAKKELQRIGKGKNVFVQKDTIQPNRDAYGRLLRFVYLQQGDGSQGILLNNELLKNGYAYRFAKYANQHTKLFTESEKLAQKEKRGLWSPHTCNGKRYK